MSFFFKTLFSSAAKTDNSDEFFQKIYFPSFVCDACDRSHYDEINLATREYDKERGWLLEKLYYIASVQCEDECTSGSYFDCENATYLQSFYNTKCNTKMNIDLETPLPVLREAFLNNAGEHAYEDYMEKFENQIFESSYGIDENDRIYLPEPIRKKFLKQANGMIRKKIEGDKFSAKDAYCYGKGRYSHYCPNQHWCVTKAEYCNEKTKEGLKLKSNDNPYIKEPLDDTEIEYLYAVHDLYLKSFCDICLVKMSSEEKAKFLFKDATIESRELLAMILTLEGLRTIQPLVDTSEGFLLLLQKGYIEGFSDSTGDNEERYLQLSETLIAITYKKLNDFLAKIVNMDQLNEFHHQYAKRFRNMVNIYIGDSLNESRHSRLQMGNLEKKRNVLNALNEKDNTLRISFDSKRRLLRRNRRQGQTRYTKQTEEKQPTMEERPQNMEEDDQTMEEELKSEFERTQQAELERKKEKEKAEKLKKFREACLAKDVSLKGVLCTKREKKRIILKTHQDKNPGCLEESKNKFLDYKTLCPKLFNLSPPK